MATSPAQGQPPRWWPEDLTLAAGARLMSAEKATCELSWMVPGVGVDAIAATVTQRAKEAGWEVSVRSATEQVIPTPSLPPEFLEDPMDEVVPELRGHTSIRATRDGVTAVLSLDEAENAVVIGRYRLLDDAC